MEARWAPEYIAWAPDGEGLFATTPQEILRITTAGKVNIAMHNDRAQWPAVPLPSPDGKHLAFQAQTYDFNAWTMENP
jgi:hypothetical protein